MDSRLGASSRWWSANRQSYLQEGTFRHQDSLWHDIKWTESHGCVCSAFEWSFHHKLVLPPGELLYSISYVQTILNIIRFQAPLRLRFDPPYFIYFSWGVNGDPLKFWIELEVDYS